MSLVHIPGMIRITVKDELLKKYLEKLQSASSDLTPTFREIGDYLTLKIREDVFDRGKFSKGTRWENLKRSTIRSKKRKRSKRLARLHDTETLRDSFTYKTTLKSFLFGRNMEYAATHQFGTNRATNPPQPSPTNKTLSSTNSKNQTLPSLNASRLSARTAS